MRFWELLFAGRVWASEFYFRKLSPGCLILIGKRKGFPIRFFSLFQTNLIKMRTFAVIFGLLPIFLFAQKPDQVSTKIRAIKPYLDLDLGFFLPNYHCGLGLTTKKFGLGATLSGGKSDKKSKDVSGLTFNGFGLEGRFQKKQYLFTVEGGRFKPHVIEGGTYLKEPWKSYLRVSGSWRFMGFLKVGITLARTQSFRVYAQNSYSSPIIFNDYQINNIGVFLGISLPGYGNYLKELKNPN